METMALDIKIVIPPPIKEVDFSTTLLELRKKLKKTQNEMADFLSISKRTYIAWEHGEHEPNAKTAYWLGKISEILFGNEQNPNQQINKLVEMASQLQTEIAKLKLKEKDF